VFIAELVTIDRYKDNINPSTDEWIKEVHVYIHVYIHELENYLVLESKEIGRFAITWMNQS
jgi:hypothetical protein